MILFENVYYRSIIIGAILLFSSFLNYKTNKYYDTLGHEERMRNHQLNKKYNLNSIKNLDYARINKSLWYAHLAAIAIGCAAMIFDLYYGAILYLILWVAFNKLMIYYMGEKYTKKRRKKHK